MTKKQTAKPGQSPKQLNEFNQTPEQAQIEARDIRRVSDAVAVLVENGRFLPEQFREAIQRYLVDLSAEGRWRHQAAMVRRILPALMTDHRRGAEARMQNTLDVEKAAKKSFQQQQPSV